MSSRKRVKRDGGIAPGVDRMIMLIAKEPNIRVAAPPKKSG